MDAPVGLEGPVTAQASLRPCQLYAYHSPRVVRTQGHHLHPRALQERVYGGEIRDKELLWCCGTDHDSIHAWLDWLLGDAHKPDPEPGRKAKAVAQEAFEWYEAAIIAHATPKADLGQQYQDRVTAERSLTEADESMLSDLLHPAPTDPLL